MYTRLSILIRSSLSLETLDIMSHFAHVSFSFNFKGKDIEVYYVPVVHRKDPDLGDTYPKGMSFTKDQYRMMDLDKTPKANATCLITNHDTYYTLPHELFHILSGDALHSAGIHNLMAQKTTPIVDSEATTVSDTKRLTKDQADKKVYTQENADKFLLDPLKK